jgi:hypothetical protein
MPRIIINCPTTGEDVPTGHRTQDFDLSAMAEARSFRCPVCHQVHAWRGEDARIEHGLTPTATRLAAMLAGGPT